MKIYLYCSKCGNQLHYDTSNKAAVMNIDLLSSHGDFHVSVAPCDRCNNTKMIVDKIIRKAMEEVDAEML